MSTPARVGPDLELIDGRGAERVGGADERLLAVEPQAVGELADRGGLAGAVHADDQHDARALSGPRERRLGSRRRSPAVRSVSRARRLSPRRDAARTPSSRRAGRRQAHVGAEQQLFERLDRVDVDAVGLALGRIGAPHDLVEALRQPFGGARESLREFVEQAHQRDLSRPGRRATGACPACAVSSDGRPRPAGGAPSARSRPRPG